MTDRRGVLSELLELLRSSITEAPVDKRAPIAHQIRGVLSDLAELPAATTPEDEESNGLLSFQRALADRKSAPKTAREAEAR